MPKTLFTFHWPNQIGYIHADTLEEAVEEAAWLWQRPYHTRKDKDGNAIWYDTVAEAEITQEYIR